MAIYPEKTKMNNNDLHNELLNSSLHSHTHGRQLELAALRRMMLDHKSVMPSKLNVSINSLSCPLEVSC